MDDKFPPKAQSLKRVTNLSFFVLFAVILWVARYWHSATFGLYEDDQTNIPQMVQMPWGDLLRYVGSYIIHLYGHGRPFSDSLILIFSHLGWQIADIQGMYWIGYLIEVLNVSLFYVLLQRVAGSSFAVVASLAYVLFSADTTQAWVTASLGLQPALTFLLLALLFYLSDRRWLAYLFALLMILTYETPFLVFLAAPLMRKEWNRKLLKEGAVHAGILVGILLAVLALRSSIGEGRVAGLGFPTILTTPILHMIQGPVVSLGTYLYRPLQALRGLNLEVGLASGLALIGLVWLLSRLPVECAVRLGNVRDALRAGISLRAAKGLNLQPVPEPLRTLGRMAVTGAAMLILAYPLTFTIRAYAITGRDTRVHFAAAPGAAICCGCAVMLCLWLAAGYRQRWVGVGLLSVFFALLVGYGFLIQRDYTLGWQYQREFWQQLVTLAPDAGADTVILVDPAGLPDSRQIGANTWNLPRILNQIYQIPAEWKKPPRVYRLAEGWQQTILTSENKLALNGVTTVAPPSLYGNVDPANVILVQWADGRLVRSPASLKVGGQVLALKAPTAPVVSTLPHGFLYDYLVAESVQ